MLDRCGLVSREIAEAYAMQRPLPVGWSMTLLVSGGLFAAYGIQTMRSGRDRTAWVSSIGFLGVGSSLLVAAVISLVLLVETQELVEAAPAYRAAVLRYSRLSADSLLGHDYQDEISSATLAVTTWNPLQQVLVFAIAPAALAVAIAWRLAALRTVGRIRSTLRYGGLLCALLLLAGLVSVVYPNTAPLRLAFAIGLGAAPLVLAYVTWATQDVAGRPANA
jgi:hypothetical protein